MPDADPAAVLIRAQRSLEEQRFEDARAAIEEGQAQFPDDAKVHDLYMQIYLADGVRRHRKARDLRRDEIRKRNKRDRLHYRNSEEIVAAFREAIASLDKVLATEPDHPKALLLRAGVLDRMDRKGTRAKVQELLDRALALHPESPEIAFAQDRLLTSCAHCHDTGLCAECHGAGEVSAMLLKSRCPVCRGKGICPRCGLL